MGTDEYARNVMSIFTVRDVLPIGFTLGQLARLAAEMTMRSPVGANRRAIARHYELGDEFYLAFLDHRYHLYSQCQFDGDHVSLEDAAERKLEHVWSALALRSGDHVLDVGGGWGGFERFCQERDVRVTTLTLSRDSARFIREHTRAEVIVQDLLEHRVRERYDHVVILGVIEHIPAYRRVCERVWEALKPGGRLYLDASATREKYALSAFARRYIWNGVHSCLCLQDLVRELLFHGFEISSVCEGRQDYEWTMRAWAENLEKAQTFLCSRWSESLYRAFRIFLWGGAHAFRTGRLQAYSVVAERGRHPGPRPGLLRRAAHSVAAMR